MKKIFVFSLVLIMTMDGFAQIKLDTKKLVKAKEVMSTVSASNNQKPSNTGNTPSNEVPQNTNGANTPSGSAPATSNQNTTGGWSMQILNTVATTNAYFLSGGWILDQFSAKSSYSPELNIPVIEANFWSYCYDQPITLRVFKFSDKDALLAHNFEAEGKNKKGRYTSEMIISYNDKYILLLSYYAKTEPELDKFMEEKMPDLKRRLPGGNW